MDTILDDYVSDELAVKLKTFGFDQPSPTLNIVRKWIKKQFDVEINVRCTASGSLPDRLDGNILYVVDIADFGFQTWVENNIMEDSYKDALVKAMIFVLNKINTNN